MSCRHVVRVVQSLTLACAACSGTPAGVAEYAKLQRDIEVEFAQRGGSQAWAGCYCAGDGLSDNDILCLFPRGVFSVERSGCLRLVERSHDSVRERDGRLEFSFAAPNARGELRGFDDTLLVIRWNERRYLVAPERMSDFANESNEDGNVSDTDHFLRRGDDSRPVSGKSAVPPKYEHLFLDAPIEVRIIELAGSRIERFNDREYGAALVRLDVGTDHGAFVGMVLRAADPPLHQAYRVVDAGADSSIAARSFFALADPEVGWKLWTKY